MKRWYDSCFARSAMLRHGRGERGYTLAELMVVVAMVAVLAVLAVYGVRKYVMAAKSTEPVYMIGLIQTAQEAWREEFHAYADVSATIDTYYPQTTPNNKKANWVNPAHPDATKWATLGVETPNPVQFDYATKAGSPGAGIPALGTVQAWTFPNNGEPWYVVKAVGDRNEDGNYAIFIGSSFTHEIYGEKEAE
jgi:type IV pilus assembly protein PilA